jgi:hypothetical protein
VADGRDPKRVEAFKVRIADPKLSPEEQERRRQRVIRERRRFQSKDDSKPSPDNTDTLRNAGFEQEQSLMMQMLKFRKEAMQQELFKLRERGVLSDDDRIRADALKELDKLNESGALIPDVERIQLEFRAATPRARQVFEKLGKLEQSGVPVHKIFDLRDDLDAIQSLNRLRAEDHIKLDGLLDGILSGRNPLNLRRTDNGL